VVRDTGIEPVDLARAHIGKQPPYSGFASRDAVDKLRLGGAPTPRSLDGSDDEAALTIRCWAGPPHHETNSRGVAVASTEQDKRLRAELAQELGFYPANLDPATSTGIGGSTPPSTEH